MVKKEIDVLVAARYPIIALLTHEEQRALKVLAEIAAERDKDLVTWSITSGICRVYADEEQPLDRELRDPHMGLEFIDRYEGGNRGCIFVFKDFHRYLDDPIIVRKLRDLHVDLKSQYKTVVLLAPTFDVPIDLQKTVTIIDMPLPSEEELVQVIDMLIQAFQQKGIPIDISDSEKNAAVKAGLGLTIDEFENVISKSVVMHGEVRVDVIAAEKEQIIRKSGVLEFYKDIRDISELGGLAELKKWGFLRKKAFTKEAERFGLRPPKGVLLTGVPGTGKSLTAKVLAKVLGMPLLRFDVSRIFGQYVGESEQHMAQALKIADATAPVILWFDELDKMFAGSTSSGAVEIDSGVTMRVLGQFLTWLQEHRRPVFVIATANDPLRLPPELMRSGRFDEIFFVDLPTKHEREEIFSIHINKVGRDPTKFDIPKLAAESPEFSGAEIEQVVHSALYQAFFEGEELTTEHIAEEIRKTTPLARRRRHEIERLRRWAKENARPASGEQVLHKDATRAIELQ